MLTAEDTFFNFWKNEAIHLEEGEELCSKCNGDGIVGIFTDRPISMNPKNICTHCWGEGKLDWCEKAIGKLCPLSSSTSSTGSVSSMSSTPKVKYGRKEDAKRRRNYLSEVRRKRRFRRTWRTGLA